MTEPAPNPPPEPTPEPEPKPDDTPSVENPEALWKSHEKYRHENRSLHKQLTDATAKLEEVHAASLSEQEKAVEEARKEGLAEGRAESRAALTRERINVRAATKLQDPEDAARYLDVDSFDPDKPAEIDKAIDALLKDKPYLGIVNNRGGKIDQGPQGDPAQEQQTGGDWLRSVAGRGQS